MPDKKSLSERDICTKYITPAIEKSGLNKDTHFLDKVSFTYGKSCCKMNVQIKGPFYINPSSNLFQICVLR